MSEHDLQAQLAEYFNDSAIKLTPLHQHASYRSYYRAHLSNGEHYVIMSIPEGKWSVSEEISNKGTTISELPYLNVSRYLRERNFPVPETIYSSEADGLIIIQDLGDILLENEFKNKSLDEKLDLYRQAIALLVDLQNRSEPDDSCVVFQRHFDKELLVWELNHFFDYGIESRTGQKITSEDRQFFEATATEIAQALMDQPQVLVHRDYQSRNLMICDNKLWLIDFQDALMGPLSYDLVALLRDSYIVLDRRLRESLIDEFIELQASRYQKVIDRQAFSRMFDWTTIQRKLKDAGRFVFIEKEKGNPDFLQYIPDTLSYVKEALTRQTDLKEFYERLKPYVPEWQS